MSLPRFYISPENKKVDRILFREQDWNHIRNALRLESGAQVYAFDGHGIQYLVRLDRVDKQGVEGVILQSEQSKNESSLAITLGQAWLQDSKMSVLVRQVVELGIVALYPLVTERCQVKKKALQESNKALRWEEIARQAARQSGRSRVPEIQKKFYSPKEFFAEAEGFDLKLLFWEDEKTTTLQDISAKEGVKTASLLFGPEGGWSLDEIESARGQGYQTISLGPRILRAETAPLTAISVLQYLWGDI